MPAPFRVPPFRLAAPLMLLAWVWAPGCALQHGQELDSMVSSVSVVNARIEDIRVRYETRGGRRIASFVHQDGTRVTPFAKLYAPDEVTAETKDGKTDLYLKGRGIGFVVGERVMICDDYEYGGQRYSFACDAVFYFPVAEQVGRAQASLRINFTDPSVKDGVGPMPPPPSGGLSLAGQERVDLSPYAQNQINQFGTGTCLYNATTGLLEWFYARTTGQRENFAEGDVLARLTLPGRTAPELEAWVAARSLKTIAKDSVLPTDWLYKNYGNFYSAQAFALNYETKIAASPSSVVPLDLRLRGETLYWYGRNQNGRMTEAELRKVADWIVTKKSPVQLFANYNGIWHVIIVLGYDPASQEFLIKDSLGNTNIKGSWQSKQFVLQFSYGAVGYASDKPFVTEASAAPNNQQQRPKQDEPKDSPTATPPPKDQASPAPVDPKTDEPAPPGQVPPTNDAGANDPAKPKPKPNAQPQGQTENGAGSATPALNQDLCYMGWVKDLQGDFVCSVWNIADQKKTGKVYSYVPKSQNTARTCSMTYIKEKVGDEAYGAVYRHCNGRYAVWTGKYY